MCRPDACSKIKCRKGERGKGLKEGKRPSKAIAVDLDNVIAATDPEIRRLVKGISGVSLSQDDIRSWDYAEALIDRGVALEEARNIVVEAFTRFHDLTCSKVVALEGSISGLLSLRRAGLELVVVIGRPRTVECERRTREWLQSNSIPDSWLLFEAQKAGACDDWALLIDDAPHHATEVANRGTQVLLFHYPWNSTLTTSSLIQRVNNWTDIVAAVRGMSKKGGGLKGGTR